jgi:HNH endonuclease
MAQKYVPVALRRLVRERAGERCEYCLTPERLTLAAHWVDHIVAEKHGGRAEEGNLALSRVLCNQHKGSDLTSIDPETGQIAPLFHPRRDAWPDHFRLTVNSGKPSCRPGRCGNWFGDSVPLVPTRSYSVSQHRLTWILELGIEQEFSERHRRSIKF